MAIITKIPAETPVNFKALLSKNKVFLDDLQNKSRSWFTDQVASLTRQKKITPNTVLYSPDIEQTSRIIPGHMYMYWYDPKTKADLPYYDRFPLVFPFRALPDGFIGLNLHYLHYKQRTELLQALYDTSNNKRMDARSKLRLSWSIIQGISQFPLAKPCVKRYLYSHIRSPLGRVKSQLWATAALLPLQKFVGQTENFVWNDSLEKIGRKRKRYGAKNT